MVIRTGYFGFEVSDLDAWQNFGMLLGLGIDRSTDGLFLRMDERARALHCVEGPADDIAWLGWEAADRDEYQAVRNHLESMGIATHDGGDTAAELRGVGRFYHFSGPNGVQFEIAHDIHAGPAFVSQATPHGFVTGDQGIGHVALNSTDHKGDEKFVREALKAQLSDYIYQPLPDGGMLRASFLHTSPRHHSIAFAEGLGNGARLNHFQIEMAALIDVGLAYERVQAAGVPITVTLGQHSNDRMVSFYAQTPSQFTVEVGCFGLRIDDEENWSPVIHDRISEWGHKFQGA